MHTTSRAEQSRVELGVQAVPCRRTAPFLLAPKNCNEADCGRVAWQSRLPSRNAISLGCKWVLHSLAYADVPPSATLLAAAPIYLCTNCQQAVLYSTYTFASSTASESCELRAVSCELPSWCRQHRSWHFPLRNPFINPLGLG